MKCNDTSLDDIFQIGVFRDKEFTSLPLLKIAGSIMFGLFVVPITKMPR